MDIAERLLDLFQNAVDGRQLDAAYIYGLRFAHLALDSLPKHPGWKRSSGKDDVKRRKRLAKQVDKVLSMMEVIKQRMDAEELVKIQAERLAREEQEEREKSLLESQRRREQEQRDALEEERQLFLAKQRKKDIETSAMAKLAMLNAMNTGANSDEKAVSAPSQTGEKKQTSKAKIQSPPSSKTKPEKKQASKTNVEKSKKIPAAATGVGADATTVTTSKAVDSVQKHAQQPLTTSTKQQPKKESKAPASSKVEHLPATKDSSKKQTKFISSPSDQQPVAHKAERKMYPPRESPNKSYRKTNGDTSLSKLNPDAKHQHRQQQETSTVSVKQEPERIETILDKSTSSVPKLENPTTLLPDNKQNTLALTPMSQKEQAVIDLLKRNIDNQERRLEDIENNQIPSLHNDAKISLKHKNKAEALKCVARKKRLEEQVDVIKASIFNMETQMFMLENAMEDRHVKKALDEAASAISGLQQGIGDPNATIIDLVEFSATLPKLDDEKESDEELLEELQEWLSPEEAKKAKQKEDYTVSILSMPNVPKASSTTERSSSVQKILHAVLGT
jgi:hypothetical protein